MAHVDIPGPVAAHPEVQKPIISHLEVQKPVVSHYEVQELVVNHPDIQGLASAYRDVQEPTAGHRDVQESVASHPDVQESVSYFDVQGPVASNQRVLSKKSEIDVDMLANKVLPEIPVQRPQSGKDLKVSYHGLGVSVGVDQASAPSEGDYLPV